MEEVIARILEQSIISGAFILVLYHILHKQDEQLKNFSQEMKNSNKLLLEISKTLSQFGSRLENLERKGDKDAD